MTPAAFAGSIAAVPTTAATPEGVADILRLSRQLYMHGFFVYEFVTVAAHYSLMAIEAGLSHRLKRGPRESLHQLIDRAQAEQVIDDHDHELLQEAVRKLRNSFSHPERQQVWSPAIAARALLQAHRIVTQLFPDPDPSLTRADGRRPRS